MVKALANSAENLTHYHNFCT